jgi:hypothetical protein
MVTIQEYEHEIERLKDSQKALRSTIHVSYMYGADGTFLDTLEKSLIAISKRLFELDDNLSHAHRLVQTK